MLARRVLPPVIAVLFTACGGARAETLLARGSSWRYAKGTREASDPRGAWRTPDFPDAAWARGRAPFGYGEAGLNTTFPDMQNSYSCVFIREFFSVAGLDADTRLKAAVDYDDGFIIWINGEKVLDKNEPDGSPLYDSLASASHEAGAFETFELPAPEEYLEVGENVIAVQVFNSSKSSGDCKIDVELSTFKRVADTTFSADRGFYDRAFDVTISTATAGATIRYTTDGSLPSATSGTVLGAGGRISITGTTCLRAAAFKGGYDPTDVDTHTYIFLDDVLTQPARPAGFPSKWWKVSQSFAADYQMDPAVVNDTAHGYAAMVTDALTSIPTLSIVMKKDDIFGSRGWLMNGWSWSSQNDPNENYEHACSAELIYPAGYPLVHEGGFQIDCGLRPHSHAANHKRSFKLRFHSRYGPGKLNYPFFESAPLHADSAADAFDWVVMRAGGNESWKGASARTLATTYTHDEWARASQLDMSGFGSRSTYMHVYLDGLYWGLYNAAERPDESFLSAYLGGEPDHWWWANHGDITFGSPEEHGDASRFDYFVNTLGDQAVRDMANAANYETLKAYVDIEQFCDYILLWWYCGGGDWQENWNRITSVNNVYLGHLWQPSPQPMKWFVWDCEESWYDYNEDYVWMGGDPNSSGRNRSHDGAWIKPQFFTAAEGTSPYPYDPVRSPGQTYIARPVRNLVRNGDFRTLFADRTYRHCANGGALTDASSRERWLTLCDFIEDPIVLESARWGDSSTPFTVTNMSGQAVETVNRLTRHQHWYRARDNVLAMMNGNTGRLINNYLRSKAMNGYTLYPSIDPPNFQQHGGAIAAGFKLTMSTSAGHTIYYTRDGSDPRKAGGSRLGTRYTGPVTLSRTTHVKARSYRSNHTWSAVHEATFNYTGHYGSIRITEILYNPLGGGDFEFVEIKNTGSATRGLSAMCFKGIRYTFPPGTDLAGGALLVIANNAQAFQARYGVAPFGEYQGALDNGGERIRLLDSDGRTVTSVRYNDKDPWPREADGDGFSLVFDGAGEQDDPAKWRASNLIGGSPGYDDGAPCRVVVNEALTHTDLPQVDVLELYNAGDAAVDIGGWYLSDTVTNYKLHKIPSGTTLAAGGYKTFDENQLGFALDSHGDQIYLTRWDGSGNLLYLDRAVFGAAENGVAFGRHVKSTGGDDFVAQSVGHTLGSANAYPRVGPVVINEIMYNPSDLSGGSDLSAEFIELLNVSQASAKLYDSANPANTWRLTNAVDYVFPQGITLEPGEYLLVCSTNESALRSAYPDVPAGVRVFGPYSGRLGNGGESVRLVKPDSPDPDGIPWIEVDRVSYQDNDPWPESPDGDGPSLERLAASLYGNDPANWAASRAAGGTPGQANSGVLVSKTGTWRYHDQGEDLGTAWRPASFDDSRWADGNAPLGYGHLEVDTEVSYGDDPANKHMTTYFRTRFMLGVQPGQVNSLTLAARYDDGFVAYLNGQEVARGSMPTGTISWNTAAAGHSAGSYEAFDLGAHIGKLLQGVNLLAVEVHQSGPASGDLFIDMELRHTTQAANPPAAPSGLTAQAVSTSRINLAWQDNSNNEQGFKVDRRQSGGSAWTRMATLAAGVEAYSDTGLPAGTKFYYRVKAHNADGDSGYSNVADATTDQGPPPPGFTAYNDLLWLSGQTTYRITTYTSGQSGALIDYGTGHALPAVLTVAGGEPNVASPFGALSQPGTDAAQVFSNRVDCLGVIQYASENLTLQLSGLDPGTRYEFVLFGNRNNANYTDRYSTATISGAAGFANASTPGAKVTTTAVPDDTTIITNGYNTLTGYVARFTQIDPGPDGTFLVTVSDNTSRFYANALMLKTCAADPVVVALAKGSTWKWRKGTAEASDPVHAWTSLVFDDSSWSSGPAPFGYGDGPYGTTLPDMRNSYSSVFLRSAFSIQQSALVVELRLWAQFDDGFILWVNGEETARVNVPGAKGEFSPYDGFAAANMETNWSAAVSGADLPVLRTGTNEVAVQVFNRSLDSSDLTFDAQVSIVNSQLSIEADADQDGMPDAWETACLSDLSDPSDRTDSADPDGDGLSNLQEYVAGTDPTEASQTFEVDLSVAGTGVLVSFAARAAAGSGYEGLARYYELQEKGGGGSAWTGVSGCQRILGAGQTVVYTNTSPAGADGQLYRARVWLE
ncbi:MAG: lamin tail domain-containing protein [Kiritimatiellae bacterium]|nr:lamin tail domain-containing protein [Kiritimatiellia bacterium]